jgi:replicative DNA helicase
MSGNEPPPADLTAEHRLLAGILCDATRLAEALRLTPPEAIADRYCRAAFELLHKMTASGQQPLARDDTGLDVEVLAHHLELRANPPKGGWIRWLFDVLLRGTRVSDAYVFAKDLPDVRRAWKRRRAIAAVEVAAEALRKARPEVEGEVESAITELEAATAELEREGSDGTPETVYELSRSLNFRIRTSSTGIDPLDFRLGGGLAPGCFYVLAGQTGTGKSMLMAEIAYQTALREHVLFESLEMSRRELTARFLSRVSGVPTERLRSDWQTPADLDSTSAAIRNLLDVRLEINDVSALTLERLRLDMRATEARGPLALCCIDYLQLMRYSGARSRYEEVSEISRGLKELAREFDCAVLAAAQLSRAPNARQSKEPHLSDLRDSGQIEQDADAVFFLWREPETPQNVLEASIAKNRHGRTGVFQLQWEPEIAWVHSAVVT